METLNFQDEEQFSEFPFQLDDEHLLDTDVMDILNCDEISQIIENHEFNFTTFDSNNPTLETKQALDENLVTMPAIEDIAQKKTLKEDYAKVLNKWQEHVDCLEKSDMDLQLSDLDLQMNENFIDDFYNSTSSSIPLSPVNRILQKSTENNFYTSFAQDFGKISKVNILNNNLEVDSNTRELNPLHQTDNSLQETTSIDNLNNLNVGDNKKIESNHHDKKIKSDYHDKIESDHSETEIDVVGIDSVDELNSSSIFLDERSQNNRTKSETKNRKYNSTLLGNNIILIKQEHNSHKGKKKSPNIRVDKKPAETFSSRNDSKISKDDKNLLKKQKNSIPIKKKKCEKVLIEHPNRGKKKPKKDSKLENSEQKPVALHATNVASLLEQFEATENAATANVNNGYNTKNRFMSRDNCNSKTVHKKNIKKSKNIYEVSPEEIVSKIKASENQKSKKKIAIIPAIPLKKEDSKRVEMKKKESRSFKIQNKSKNKVSEDPQLSSPCHSNVDVPIFFDHDYCVTQNIKFKKCCKSNSNVIDCSGNDNKVPKNVPMKSSKSLNDKIKQMNCSQKSSTLVKKQICKPTDSKSHFDDGMHKKEDTSSNVKLNERMIALNETSLKQPNHTLPSKSKSECQSNLYLNKTAVITPMNKTKTDSVLSEKVLTQSSPHDKSCDSMFNSNQQLVSVLKKPPTASTQNFSGQNESIITTTNSSNDRVKNIIVQHLKPELSENVPQRKKLNLAEYRSRKGTHKIVYKMEKSPVSLAYDPSYADCETSINSKPCVEINNEKSRENNFDEGIQMLDAPISNTINHKIDLLVSEAKLNEKVQVKVELEYAKENNQSISSELVEQENEKKLTKQIATKVEPVEEGEIEDSEQSDQNDVKPVLSIKCEKEELKYEKVVIENDDLRIADVKKPLASSTSSRDRKMRRYSKKYRDSSESSLSRSRSRSHSSHRSDSPRSSRNPRRQSHNRRSHRDRSCSYRSRSTRSRSRSYEYRYRSHNGRSRSRKCSVKRNKRISRRRSSVSSRSSWSSRSWSRSRSRYRSSSSYSRSSRSTSRSKSRLRSRSRSRSWKSRSRSPRRCFSRRSSYSRSPISQYRRPNEKWYNNEKQRQIEERRVVYVGQLEDNITKSDLRRRFEVFGSVIDLSLHFRDRGHNYGFVTYAYKDDAYKAVEHGNDDPKLPRYDLCFGGRRQFCQQKYADLDGAATNSYYNNDRGENVYKPPQQKESFDFLLKETKEIMRKRVV